MKVVIERSSWGTKKLHDTLNGSFCALGFVGLACGYSPYQMADAVYPGIVANKYGNKWPDGIVQMLTGFWYSTDLAQNLMDENDNTKCLQREQRVIEVGKDLGIEFVFED